MSTQPGQRRSVLFADDEPGLRGVAARALAAAGFEVDTAGDGAEALRMLRGRSYDVTVIDIIMPEREGVETIVEIKARWPQTFVVAISGGGRIGPDDFLGLARMVGADAVLKKPFQFADLLALIGPAEGGSGAA